ncbi:hypothetical protein PILCRDRAFT_830085 [Piloderma croceum F 1598]|uniref:Uncharacterized protein n=1 Tax=Piloderma croceum (strain F 1598) TaxID=765440 RepID=A0A0C3EGQ5_PILCF|nr:hypothetical protein PILCRDRAFT_830085 [Piloderma croceum F 1598]
MSTNDACPGVGNDTPHMPLPYIQFRIIFPRPLPQGLMIHLSTSSFPISSRLECWASLTVHKSYTSSDDTSYGHLPVDIVLGLYASPSGIK